MADGSTREIASLRPGDEIVGTTRIGDYRRYRNARSRALGDAKPAYRVTLEDGTELSQRGSPIAHQTADGSTW